MAATDSERRARQRPLIEGTQMRCPRCKRQHNVLEYVPLMQIEEFANETNPIVKCPNCRWLFSPGQHVREML